MNAPDNVVRLRRPPLVDEDGRGIITWCADPVHVFAERPGWCQCGAEFWDAENDPPRAGGAV